MTMYIAAKISILIFMTGLPLDDMLGAPFRDFKLLDGHPLQDEYVAF
jgi:hypothetical protein